MWNAEVFCKSWKSHLSSAQALLDSISSKVTYRNLDVTKQPGFFLTDEQLWRVPHAFGVCFWPDFEKLHFLVLIKENDSFLQM